MAATALPYPPAPPGVPDDLAAPPWDYRARVGVVLASLLLFILAYLGLLLGSGYLVYWAVATPLRDPGPLSLLLRGGLALVGGLLFLFLVKGLFRRRAAGAGEGVEVTERDQPELFAFLRQLAVETRAPLPRRVFLTEEVNASVCYDRSLVGLVWPVRKNLVLGLGLVNVLTLSELKAVLAHELGHFSQKSMKLGSYVYVTTGILADVVYGRDVFDQLVDEAAHPVFRLTAFVAVFRGVQWCVRLLLGGLFRALNGAHSALARQMEFNADLVAVSAAGSDAIVHALARLVFADESLEQAERDLRAAATGRRLYTRDLFHHQTRAAEFLRAWHHDAQRGEPPPLPDDTTVSPDVFHPDDDIVPDMWPTHPPNPERERNAKRRYVRSVLEDRSAWTLFREPARLREQVTRRYYRLAHRLPANTPLSAPEEVQAFLDAERAGTILEPLAHSLYEARDLEPGTLTELYVLLTTVEPWDADRIRRARARLLGDRTKTLAEDYQRRLRERDALDDVQSGTRRLRGGLVEFRGGKYAAAEVPGLLDKLDAELADDRLRLAAHDREVFRVHAHMSLHLGPALSGELLARYEFHLKVQEVARGLAREQARLDEVCQFLTENKRLEEHEYEHALTQLQEAHEALRQLLLTAEGLAVPALANVRAGESLRRQLLERPPVAEPGRTLSWEWIEEFGAQLDAVRENADRVCLKSLSALLALQDRISRAWEASALTE